MPRLLSATETNEYNALAIQDPVSLSPFQCCCYSRKSENAGLDLAAVMGDPFLLFAPGQLAAAAHQRGERRRDRAVPPARAHGPSAGGGRFPAAVGEESWTRVAAPKTRPETGLNPKPILCMVSPELLQLVYEEICYCILPILAASPFRLPGCTGGSRDASSWCRGRRNR
jgi:hypothetical protein